MPDGAQGERVHQLSFAIDPALTTSGAGKGGMLTEGGVRMAEEGNFHRRMQDLMEHPERWHAVDLDTFKQLVFFQCLLIGGTGEIDMARKMGRHYTVLTERVGEGDRLQMVDYVARSLETGVGTVDSLIPFIFGDPEVRVVAAASFELALRMPLKDGDPMTGPKTLRSMSDNVQDETTRLGLLAGLLSLGDRRALPLLEGCWERLGRTARARLCCSWSGVAYASLVDFLVGRMESAPDEKDLHTIGEALAVIPGRSGQGKVVDVGRKFPSNAPDNLPLIRVIEEWTFPEYGERIGPRLIAMMKMIPASMVIPKVLRAWDISPD